MPSRRRRTQKRRSGSVMRITSGSPQEIRAMNSMIQRGPLTIMLVFRSTCPHCVTYKPIWEELCKTKGRKANMVSMESDIYQELPMASEKPISGVPTVLYVNPQGDIEEVETPRDKKAMTQMIRSPASSVPSSLLSMPSSMPSMPSVNSSMPSSMPSSTTVSEPRPMLPPANSNFFKSIPSERPSYSELRTENSIIPGTMFSENPLAATPANPIPSEVQENQKNQKNQKGGDPFSAFLLAAAQQAAPAAALLGAYAALPAKRSSGLGAPRRTRRRRNH